MVDLPKVPFPDSVTQPVRTSVSSGEVAAPYQELARGLDRVGEKLSEVSVPFAEKAADQAVRIDDSGNPIVDRSPFPMVGDAAVAYARRTRMTFAAKTEPQIQNDMLKLRLEHPNDPQAFSAAAKAYGEEKIGQIDDPTLKSSIGTMVSTNAAQNYRTSLVETDRNSVAEHLQTIQARLKDINERGALLARQGGTDTPEYQSLSHERETFYTELGNDPKIKFAPERAALEIKENRDNDIGQAVIGEAQRIFKTKDNLGEAKKFLKDAFWESDKIQNMTPAKRNHFVAEGLHALDNIDSKDREAISENGKAVTKYISESQANPRQWNPIAHDNMIQRAEEIGDTKSVHELQTQRTFMPLWNDLKQMNGPEQAQAIDMLSRGIRPGGPNDKFIEAEAKRVGLDPNVLRRYAQIESSGNPYASTGSYKGLFQLSNDEFAKNGGVGNIFDAEQNTRAAANSLRARADLFKQKYNREPTATELYLAHQQGDAGLAAHLANPDAPAWQNMLSTGEGRQKGAGWARAAIWGNIPTDVRKQFPGGVDTVTSRDFAAVWERKVEGQLIPGAPVNIHGDNATAKLWESSIHEARTQTGKFAQEALVTLKKQVSSGGEVKPEAVADFIHMAIASGHEELFKEAEPFLGGHDMNASLEPGTSASVFEARVAAAKSAGVSDVQSQAMDIAVKLHQQSLENLKTKPLFEGSQKGYFAPPNELPTNNPQALVSELQTRNANIEALKQRNPQMGPTSVIDKDEAVDFGTKLSSGDPAQAAQALTALQTIPEPNRLPTMVALKDSIIGMSRSNDPVKFNAGMTALSTMWQTHKPEFEALFGGEAMTRMLAFQGLQGSLDVPTIMARLNTADDPNMAAGREKIGERVDKETKDWTPRDVAYQLGSSYGIPGTGFISRAIGTTPAVPLSEPAAEAMQAEFTKTYKALRQYGVPQDAAMAKAVEGLKSEWQPSQVSGGALMKHAPEAYYPTIAGNHDWLRTDLQDHIASVLGPQVSMGDDGTFKQHWTFKGILSDPQTARDVKSPPPGPDGKPRGPSYQIVVTDERGQDQILMQNGVFSRFAWDPSSRVAAGNTRAKSAFDARRSDISTVQPYQGMTGPM